MRRAPAVALLLGGLLLAAPVLAGAAVTTKEIEDGLTCQCGCGLTVHACNHLQCGSAIPLRQQVAALVREGLGRDEILVRFRDEYGEKILSSPTTEGFNLTAWVLPFAAVAAGAALVFGTLRRWTGRGAPEPPRPGAPLSAADRERLDAELRDGA